MLSDQTDSFFESVGRLTESLSRLNPTITIDLVDLSFISKRLPYNLDFSLTSLIIIPNL